MVHMPLVLAFWKMSPGDPTTVSIMLHGRTQGTHHLPWGVRNTGPARPWGTHQERSPPDLPPVPWDTGPSCLRPVAVDQSALDVTVPHPPAPSNALLTLGHLVLCLREPLTRSSQQDGAGGTCQHFPSSPGTLTGEPLAHRIPKGQHWGQGRSLNTMMARWGN